jgi:hypothetical protein
MSNNAKPASGCTVEGIVSLKQNVSAVLQEALSGMDAWGDPTRFRDSRGYVRWGMVEQQIHKFIDEANAEQPDVEQKERKQWQKNSTILSAE